MSFQTVTACMILNIIQTRKNTFLITTTCQAIMILWETAVWLNTITNICYCIQPFKCFKMKHILPNPTPRIGLSVRWSVIKFHPHHRYMHHTYMYQDQGLRITYKYVSYIHSSYIQDQILRIVDTCNTPYLSAGIIKMRKYANKKSSPGA